MPCVNQVQLMGHIGRDPDIRITQGGNPVVRFSIATTERWQKDDEWQEKTVWHNVIAWAAAARQIENGMQQGLFNKGDLVFIEGKINNRTYEKDGTTKHISEIIASRILWLRHPDKRKAESQPDQSDEELPF